MTLTIRELKDIIQRRAQDDLYALIEHAKETVPGWVEETAQEIETEAADLHPAPAPVVLTPTPAPVPAVIEPNAPAAQVEPGEAAGDATAGNDEPAPATVDESAASPEPEAPAAA